MSLLQVDSSRSRRPRPVFVEGTQMLRYLCDVHTHQKPLRGSHLSAEPFCGSLGSDASPLTLNTYPGLRGRTQSRDLENPAIRQNTTRARRPTLNTPSLVQV